MNEKLTEVLEESIDEKVEKSIDEKVEKSIDEKVNSRVRLIRKAQRKKPAKKTFKNSANNFSILN